MFTPIAGGRKRVREAQHVAASVLITYLLPSALEVSIDSVLATQRILVSILFLVASTVAAGRLATRTLLSRACVCQLQCISPTEDYRRRPYGCSTESTKVVHL